MSLVSERQLATCQMVVLFAKYVSDISESRTRAKARGLRIITVK